MSSRILATLSPIGEPSASLVIAFAFGLGLSSWYRLRFLNEPMVFVRNTSLDNQSQIPLPCLPAPLGQCLRRLVALSATVSLVSSPVVLVAAPLTGTPLVAESGSPALRNQNNYTLPPNSSGTGFLDRKPAQRPMPALERSLSLPELYSDLYTLGPGDGLQLIFLDPEAKTLNGTFGILADGTTTLPLVGSVQLIGLTIGQATRWLTSLYSKQLVRPQLTLTLTTPRPVKVTIVGEVTRPGLYPLGSFSNPVEAIQIAGGVTLNADVRNINLRRLAGSAGAQKETTLNLADLFTNGNQLQNPVLFDGDTIIVSRAIQPVPEEVLAIGQTNLSPLSINVTVIGEVKSPGTVSLSANTPLIEAIFRSGGLIKRRAKSNQIELVRFNRNGTTTRQVFAYKEDLPVSNLTNPPLRNGDTIIVRSNLYGKALNLFNDLAEPLGAINSIFSYANYWNYWNNNNNSR
jgi:polysaccharide biosynthesis/export protein